MIAVVTLGTMFWLAIVFFIIAMVAWALGAGGVAGMSRDRPDPAVCFPGARGHLYHPELHGGWPGHVTG